MYELLSELVLNMNSTFDRLRCKNVYSMHVRNTLYLHCICKWEWNILGIQVSQDGVAGDKSNFHNHLTRSLVVAIKEINRHSSWRG